MPKAIWSIAPRPVQTSTRDRIIDAAAMRFYEQGFHAVGLDAILEDVGVTKTTFYNHFESKDDLIVAVLADRDQRDMDSLRVELDARGGTARDRILAVFDILGEWFDDPDFKGCLFINATAQFPNPNDPIHQAAAAHGANMHRFYARLAADLGASDPEMLAKQLCMLVVAGITARHVSCDVDAAATAKHMAEALLDRAAPHG